MKFAYNAKRDVTQTHTQTPTQALTDFIFRPTIVYERWGEQSERQPCEPNQWQAGGDRFINQNRGLPRRLVSYVFLESRRS